VRFLADGTLEFSGRLDHQVKIRGHRIELGEIEAVLGAHAALREVVVVAETRGGDARLVAYFSVREGQTAPSASELRAHLRKSLPEYMLPSVLAELPSLPRTPNGKLDRKALPSVEAQSTGEGTPPRTATERALAPLWADVLGLGTVSISDDFFELGGHSLLATKLMARVRSELGLELPLRAFFEAPTLEAFAARVDQMGSKQGENAPPPVVRVPRDGPLVPSFAQERMWVLSELEGANPAYNVSGAVRLRGALDTDALRAAFAALVQRHEALRTHFAVLNGALSQVIEPAGPIDLPVSELALAGEDARVRAVLVAAREDANHVFDPLRGPLFRVRLLRFEGDDHALIFTLHHIVSDEWSRGVIVRDYCQLYAAFREGRAPELPELTVQYADYAAWQRLWLEGPVLDEQLGYWKSRLAGAPSTCALPPDRPRSRTPSFRGERLPLVVSKDLTQKLEAFARKEGLTLFMVLLAGVDVWLTRHGAGEDLVIGTPIANRARPELEGLVGFFANTLVLRVDVSGGPSFRDVCRRVKESCLGAYAHQDVPFERIVEAVAPERDPARHPVFQTLFNLLNAAATVPPMGGIAMSWVPIDSGTAKFDLGMDLAAVDGELRGIAEWNLDLYDDATARRLIARFPTLLADALARPELPIGDLALMTDDERSAVLAAGKGTGGKLAAIRALLNKK
jgi:acyl carrier protein